MREVLPEAQKLLDSTIMIASQSPAANQTFETSFLE
jgi:hypothetical protein